ncbi:hypothetical protein EXIGLDRAFT_447115 [Exidia glandulosa HHB12029]|uniref:Uncharacterized protein n=1 Tax=Exidia glandulosa HHB12029 TaxID=1314781 RepID=A0A165KA85_EXIGL|nr:hypothetical protein EXIGLDRAFT_447115 [Exidia glandulosa HHB12029]
MNMLYGHAQTPRGPGSDENAKDVTRSTFTRRGFAGFCGVSRPVRIGCLEEGCAVTILTRKQNNQRGESSILRPSDTRDRKARTGPAHNRKYAFQHLISAT